MIKVTSKTVKVEFRTPIGDALIYFEDKTEEIVKAYVEIIRTLIQAGEHKVGCIKAIRFFAGDTREGETRNCNLGLKDAKDFVEFVASEYNLTFN